MRLLAAFTLFGAAVLVTVGFIGGRVTAPSKSSDQPAAPAPATSAPVAVGTGVAGAPTRVNSLGIPVGYPHTEAGAISACGNYVSAYGNVANRAPGRIRAVFQGIAMPNVASKLANRILTVDKKNADDYGVSSVTNPSVSFDARVAGYQVQNHDANSATVLVWSTASFGIYGGSDDTAPQERWGTDICKVAWNGSDWRITDSGDGPLGPDITDRNAANYQRFTFVGGVAE